MERRVFLCALPHDHAPPLELRPDLVGTSGSPTEGGAANIVWVNRGQANDNFNTVFGANAAAARAVVDQVILDYEEMITSFNYSDGSTNFNLTVSMGGGTGTGGSAITNSTLGGKPRSGSLTLQTGNNGLGSGWYIDANPDDHGEFIGTLVNPYAGSAQAGSPAAGLADLYTVAAAEVAHCLGLGTNTALWNNRTTETGILDNAEGGNVGNFWLFQGSTIDHLLTGNNGGANGTDFNRAIHSAGPISVNINGTTWNGAQDAGNAVFEIGRRYLVPDVLGMMFADAYGYDVNLSQRDTFHSVLNEATGQLTIRGGVGNSNDVISVDRVQNTFFRVSVDAGTDVPGTGRFPGSGNLPAYVSGLYDARTINSIVVDAGGGNDTINVNYVDETNQLAVLAGAGNDTVNFALASGHMDDVLGLDLSVDGQGGTDTLVLADTANTRNDGFTVTGTTVARVFLNVIEYAAVETLRINAGGGSNVINVNALATGTNLQVNAGNGNDSINVGGTANNVEQINGTVSAFGQGGTDTLNYNDVNNVFSDTYTMTSNSITRTSATLTTFGTVETINLNAANTANTIDVNSTAGGSNTTVNANGGNDTINLGLTAAASLVLNGGNQDDVFNINNVGSIGLNTDVNGNAGSDTLNFNDGSNSASAAYTLNSTFIGRDGAGGLGHATLEHIVINAGILDDLFRVFAGAPGTALTVNGGTGDDDMEVTFLNANLGTIPAPLTFNGEGGSDAAALFDDAGAANAMTITGTQVTRNGFGGFTYGTLEMLTVSTTDQPSTVHVEATGPGCPVSVQGNGGDDTLNVAFGGGNLQSIQAPVTLNGGSGNDALILWDDQSDQDDTTTVNTSQVTHPGFGGLTYSAAERMTIHASGGDSRVELNATSSTLATTVNGYNGEDLLILGGPGLNLNTAAGSVSFSGGAGSDHAVLWDSLSLVSQGYTITGTTANRGGFGGLTYGTLEQLTLHGTPGGDTFNVNSTASGCAASLNGDDGADRFNIGSGDLDGQILGTVAANGGSGNDTVVFNDTTDGLGADTYTLTSNALSKLTAAVATWSSVSGVTIDGSPNADLYEVVETLAGTSLTINAGSGNDQFQLGKINIGTLDALAGPITINGQGGSGDAVTLHDSGSTAADNYTVTPTAVTHPGFGGLTYGTVEGITLNMSAGSNVADIRTAASAPVTVNAAGGTDTINVNETAANAPVSILPSAGDDAVNVNSDGQGQAFAQFPQTQRIGQLSVFTGGNAAILAGGDKVLTVRGININGNGVLNITDNDVIVDYSGASPLAAVEALVANGYANGTWTGGGGINSFTASLASNTGIGVAEASELFSTFPATFSGQQVDATSVLLKYTLYGDRNLDGQVNLGDFNALAANFGQGGRRWVHGDSNYDGTVSLVDFNLLAANFGSAAADFEDREDLPALGERLDDGVVPGALT